MAEIRFWDEGWTPNGKVTVPPGYQQLPAGSPFATRLAKKLTNERGEDVYVEMKHSRRGGYSRAVDCWVPAAVLREVRKAEAESASRREAEREKAGRARARRHGRELTRLAERLGELFPGLPSDERDAVVRRAFEVGSERVGRTTKLAEDRKLELALAAHARHQNTHYDERLALGEDRNYLREDIRWQVEEILEEWKGAVDRPVIAPPA